MLRTAETVANKVVGQVPPNFYQKCALRIKRAEFGKSAAGNPMLTWSLEITQPEEVSLDGVTYNLDGLEPRAYIVYNSPGQGDNAALIRDMRQKLGLNPDFDDESPDVGEYEGIIFDCMVKSKEKIARNRTGKNSWEDIKDAAGNPQSLGWELVPIDIRNIFGLSAAEPKVF